MSSRYEESSNDVTSTNNTSFRSSSDVIGDVDAHTLTTTAITRECIKQGFYRTPVCNDILYLHHKGFSHIAPTAFEPYTEVKVLWLEGNGIGSIACGEPFVQVRPPVRVDPFAVKSHPSEEDGERDDAPPCAPPASVPPSDAVATERDGRRTACNRPGECVDGVGRVVETSLSAAVHTDPCAHVPLSSPCQDGAARVSRPDTASLPRAASVPESRRDVFSSLYPTLRQLYLHNNIFRQMPDLSRFDRLDSVNLSNNFFTTVRSYCPYWSTWRAASSSAEEEPPMSDTTLSCACEPERSAGNVPAADTSSDALTGAHDEVLHGTVSVAESLVPRVVDAAAAAESRQHALNRLTERVRPFETHRACHTLISPASMSAAEVRDIPRSERGPYSTLRTLNLANNQLRDFDDVVELLCYRALSVLDLSNNSLEDGEALLLILERLPELRCVKLMGNPLVRRLPRYRKTVLSRCTGLTYLDDRPVFEEERRLVTAWAREGEQGEVAERERIRAEREEADRRRLDDFRQLMQQHRDGPHAAMIAAVDRAGASGSRGTGETRTSRSGSRETVSSATSSTTSRSASEGSSSSRCKARKSHDGHTSLAASTAVSAPTKRAGQSLTAVAETKVDHAAALDSDDMDDVYIPQ